MANTKSAKKRARQTPKRTARNTQIRSGVKTAVRQAREAILGNGKDIAATLKQAISTISKAGTKGVLHKKNVARRISRLMKQANKSKGNAAVATATVAKAKKAAPAKKAAAKKA